MSSFEEKQEELSSLGVSVYAATVDSEEQSKEVAESELLAAIKLAQGEIEKIIEAQEKLMKKAGKAKFDPPLVKVDEELAKAVREIAVPLVEAVGVVPDKMERSAKYDEITKKVAEKLKDRFEDKIRQVSEVVHDIQYEVVRRNIVEKGQRFLSSRVPDLTAFLGHFRVIDVHSRGIGDTPPRHGRPGVKGRSRLEGTGGFIVVEAVKTQQSLVEPLLGQRRVGGDGFAVSVYPGYQARLGDFGIVTIATGRQEQAKTKQGNQGQ